MYIGSTTVNKIYIGSTEVTKIYQYTTVIYSTSVTPSVVQSYLDFNFLGGEILKSKPTIFLNPTIKKIIQEKDV